MRGFWQVAAKEILPQLREKGKVVRGWLGIQIESVQEDMAKTLKMKDAQGAIITQVVPGSPAETAGLKPEDVVVAVDGRPTRDNSDLSRYIASKAPGTTVKLEVIRGGSSKTVSVTLGTFPEETAADESEQPARGRLGMTLKDLTPPLAERLDLPRGSKGALVWDVEPGEAAEQAGLQRGDLIVSVNGEQVEGVDDFERLVDAARKEGAARLRVRRGGTYSFVVLKLS